jgi:hypothetical protein
MSFVYYVAPPRDTVLSNCGWRKQQEVALGRERAKHLEVQKWIKQHRKTSRGNWEECERERGRYRGWHEKDSKDSPLGRVWEYEDCQWVEGREFVLQNLWGDGRVGERNERGGSAKRCECQIFPSPPHLGGKHHFCSTIRVQEATLLSPTSLLLWLCNPTLCPKPSASISAPTAALPLWSHGSSQSPPLRGNLTTFQGMTVNYSWVTLRHVASYSWY